jgi:hypothetical protein
MRIALHLIMYLVAHATRKPPGPANLFREEDNQIPLLPTWYNLSTNIRRIENRRYMPND